MVHACDTFMLTHDRCRPVCQVSSALLNAQKVAPMLLT